MELYQSVIACAGTGRGVVLLFLLSSRVNLPWRRHSHRLSPLLPYHFTPPENLGAARAWRRSSSREPYGRLFSARRQRQGWPIGWLLLSCHFRLSASRHRYLPVFIFRLLNYFPINNACQPTGLFTIPTNPREEPRNTLLVVEESLRVVVFRRDKKNIPFPQLTNFTADSINRDFLPGNFSG